MISDISQALAWLEKHLQTLQDIQRGLEWETLRVNADDTPATTGHPPALGSALTHKWTTIDFAKALLKFTTPAGGDIKHMLTSMCDVHRYTAYQLDDERMRPLSMPCYIAPSRDTELTQYDTSNVGRLKMLYREGLKNRYGALMRTVSGVHYNFSLPMVFWQAKCGVEDVKSGKEVISAGYFHSIHNYYRFGWVIPYLFGTSPTIYSSFLQGKPVTLPFEEAGNGMCYLPYATSLCLSDLGYTSKSQSSLGIAFNDLHEYAAGLKRAIKTPSEEYARVGPQKDDKYLQINSNILQIESELYTPTHPKRMTRRDETPSDALFRGGIEYIEVRPLDIDPPSSVGVSAQQVRFLDLLMVWYVLADVPEMNSDGLLCTRTNWSRVILEGRKPGLMLGIGCESAQFPLAQVGKDLFRDLCCAAQTLDSIYDGQAYQWVCDELLACFDDPELTFPTHTLYFMIEEGVDGTSHALADRYRTQLQEEPLEISSEADFIVKHEVLVAWRKKVEARDSESSKALLARHAQPPMVQKEKATSMWPSFHL